MEKRGVSKGMSGDRQRMFETSFGVPTREAHDQSNISFRSFKKGAGLSALELCRWKIMLWLKNKCAILPEQIRLTFGECNELFIYDM